MSSPIIITLHYKPKYSTMRPNLFQYATSELSQDAFICWLAAWASPKAKSEDQDLHELGKAFLKMLAAKGGHSINEIKDLKITRQWKNIDVTLTINKSHLIIIEDKVRTKEHAKQLQRYKKAVDKWIDTEAAKAGYTIETVTYVYFKPHPEEDKTKSIIEKTGYVIFDRWDIQSLLAQSNVSNAILKDYREYHDRLIESYESFKTLPPTEWHEASWKGFYDHLTGWEILKGWGYVSNPSGGFWPAMLEWRDVTLSDCQFIMEMLIEQGPVTFKIYTGSEVADLQGKTRGKLRNEVHHFLLDQAKAHEDIRVRKPKRFGNGVAMAVAVVDIDDWMVTSGDKIDVEKTKQRLKHYHDFLNKAMNEMQQQR